MPELPEVETIVKDLQIKVLGRTFIDVWTDFPKTIKKPKNFNQFRQTIINKKFARFGAEGKTLSLFCLADSAS